MIIGLEIYSLNRARFRRKVTINPEGIELSHRHKFDQDGFETSYHSPNEGTNRVSFLRLMV